jgi:haloalkane dehalogenase
MAPPVFRTPDDAFVSLPDWPFAPHYAEFDGLRMHYVDEGPRDAPVFLLTHGEPSWSYLYRHWIPSLVDAGYRCVAPDHIGFGRSDKVTDEQWYVIDRHIELQRALIEHLDLQQMHLFCQDWGGPISLHNACDMPERYARLFIGNTWLHHDGYEYSDGVRRWREMALDPAQFADTMPTGGIVAMTMRREHDADAVIAAYDAPFPTSESKAGARRFPVCLPFAEPELGGAAWQQRCYEQLPSRGIPVHFVWGDSDPVFVWDEAEAWHAALAGSTLDRIENAGHFVQEDAPADCVAAVLSRL